MPHAPKILAFSGSLRAGSLNRRALDHAVSGARGAGAEVTVLELRELPMPLFDADLEAVGTPENALILKRAMIASDALLIASPEYNSSITAVLKNAIDWASRQGADETALMAFRGKVAALCSASPGALGGLRGLVHVRMILGNLGTLVIPDQVAVGNAAKVLADDGTPADPATRAKLEALGRSLTIAAGKWIA